jgi:hypothetical protein
MVRLMGRCDHITEHNRTVHHKTVRHKTVRHKTVRHITVERHITAEHHKTVPVRATKWYDTKQYSYRTINITKR